MWEAGKVLSEVGSKTEEGGIWEVAEWQSECAQGRVAGIILWKFVFCLPPLVSLCIAEIVLDWE